MIVFQIACPIAIAAQGSHLAVGPVRDAVRRGAVPVDRRDAGYARTATSRWSIRRWRSASSGALGPRHFGGFRQRLLALAGRSARAVIVFLLFRVWGQRADVVVSRALHADAVRRLHGLRSRGRRARRRWRAALVQPPTSASRARPASLSARSPSSGRLCCSRACSCGSRPAPSSRRSASGLVGLAAWTGLGRYRRDRPGAHVPRRAGLGVREPARFAVTPRYP